MPDPGAYEEYSTRKTLHREIEVMGHKVNIEGNSEEELNQDEAECRAFIESRDGNLERINADYKYFDARKALKQELETVLD